MGWKYSRQRKCLPPQPHICLLFPCRKLQRHRYLHPQPQSDRVWASTRRPIDKVRNGLAVVVTYLCGTLGFEDCFIPFCASKRDLSYLAYFFCLHRPLKLANEILGRKKMFQGLKSTAQVSEAGGEKERICVVGLGLARVNPRVDRPHQAFMVYKA